MPNLEYSVRFVLSSDSTSAIDEALAKMRASGSTIDVKINVDSSGVAKAIEDVDTEVKKLTSSTDKMVGSTDKALKGFVGLSGEIQKAINKFSATGDMQGANVAFANLENKVKAYGASLKDSGEDLDSFYQLQNKLVRAQETVNRSNNNSAGVLASRAKAQQDLNRTTQEGLRTLTNGVKGTVLELRRLASTGVGTVSEIDRLFGRSATAGKSLQISVTDINTAFANQQRIVDGSNLSLHQREALTRSLITGQREAGMSIRTVNRSLSQQTQGVGQTSYAMMSFTRLLEDMPYGFRGFANNIQPTIYGLVQMNHHTEALTSKFRALTGRELPLAVRAMANFKMAMRGGVNQLLLLTSAIAVAGTLIERYMQSSKKAANETGNLSDEFLDLYEAVKLANSVLTTDYTQPILGLENYVEALRAASDEGEKALEKMERSRSLGTGQAGEGLGELADGLEEENKLLKERLAITKSLLKEGEKKIEELRVQQDILNSINTNEKARLAILGQQVNIRNRDAGLSVKQLQNEIAIETTRQRSGDLAAALLRRNLALRDAEIGGVVAINEVRAIGLRYELERLSINGRSAKEAQKLRVEYDGILLSLQRQLEDASEMSEYRSLELDEIRETADLGARIEERRAEGEEISIDQAKELNRLIEARFVILKATATLQSTTQVNAVKAEANAIGRILALEKSRLVVADSLMVKLEMEADHADYLIDRAEKLAAIDKTMNEEDYAKVVQATTRAVDEQYQISLLNRALQADDLVAKYTKPVVSDEMDAIFRMNDAKVAASESLYATLLRLEVEHGGDVRALRTMTEQAESDHAETMKRIVLTGEQEKAWIRYKTQTDGMMMVGQALEQLVGSMDAKNRAQFERQKALSASLASINAYLAISQVLRDPLIVPSYLKYAQAAAMGIAAFAQVRNILNTPYGGSARGRASIQAPAQSQGFIESDTQARSGVSGTVINNQPSIVVNVTGKVDREGIAFMVNDGFDQIGSRGIVLK